MKEEEQLEELINKMEFASVEVPHWHDFQPEIAVLDDKNYLRNKYGKVLYVQGDEEYLCVKCDSSIMSTQVAHAVHDGPFPMSGSGKCKYEEVPYCPKCEKQPAYHGSPVKVDPFDISEII